MRRIQTLQLQPGPKQNRSLRSGTFLSSKNKTWMLQTNRRYLFPVSARQFWHLQTQILSEENLPVDGSCHKLTWFAKERRIGSWQFAARIIETALGLELAMHNKITATCKGCKNYSEQFTKSLSCVQGTVIDGSAAVSVQRLPAFQSEGCRDVWRVS